jgi:hypothetical protein
MHNPLKRPILDLLKASSSPVKEYELHRILKAGEQGSAFAEFIVDCSDELRLFRQHFLVMNALYQLHDELLAQGYYLQISALEIQLQAIPDNKSQANKLSKETGFQKLSAYYQDWQHFNRTDDKEVSNLLQQFWTKYLANDEKAQALACLELAEDSNWPEIQKKYRQLCQQHHPDKGGDTLYFLSIRQAYDNLKCLYN